jgi:TPR repeat protein
LLFFEGLLLCLAIGLLYATYYHFEHVHFHVNRFYANLGYKEAQHNLAHSYMHGKQTLSLVELELLRLGVGADHHAESAVYWFRQASDQGHARAQYNLAISHLRGFNTGLQPGFVEKIRSEMKTTILSNV